MKFSHRFILAGLVLLFGCGRDTSPVIPSQQTAISVDRSPRGLEQGLSPEILLVSCSETRNVSVANRKTGEILQRLEVQDGPHQLIPDVANRRIYCLHLRENAIAILAGGHPWRVEQQLRTGGIPLAGGSLHPLTGDLWICDGVSSVHLLATGRMLKIRKKINLGRYPHAVAFAADGKTAYVTLKGENAVAVVDVASQQERQRIGVGIYPQDVLRIGSRLCVANYGSHDVSLINLEDMKEIRVPVRKHPHGLAAQDRLLWVACEGSFRIMALDTQTAKVLGSVRLGFYPGAIKALEGGALAVADPEHDQVAIITPQLP